MFPPLSNCWLSHSVLLTLIVVIATLVLVVLALPTLGAFRLRLVAALAALVVGIPMGLLQSPELTSYGELLFIQAMFWFGLVVMLGCVHVLIGPRLDESRE